MGKKELVEIARRNKIKGYSKLNLKELTELLEKHDLLPPPLPKEGKKKAVSPIPKKEKRKTVSPKKAKEPTVKELKEIAKNMKIKGYSTMKKAELQKAIYAAMPPSSPPSPKKERRKSPSSPTKKKVERKTVDDYSKKPVKETGYVNKKGEFVLHSFDDKPAYFKGSKNEWVKRWFKDGLLHRENDKPAQETFPHLNKLWAIKGEIVDEPPLFKGKDEGDEVKEVREHYNKIKNVRGEEKNILGLRKFNNWIKASLVKDAYYEITEEDEGKRIDVLDLCCGKGGDMTKWLKLGARSVVFCDVADKSLEEAKKRYNQIKGRKFRSEFIEVDCFSPEILKKLKGKKFDIISCQFALHYAFSSKDKVDTVFKTIQESLREGGAFIGTTTNARWLLDGFERRKNHTFGNSVYQVKFDAKTDKDADYGMAYSFSLSGAVEDLREYVVKPKVLIGHAEKIGLAAVHMQNFKMYEKEAMKEEEYKKLKGFMKVQPLTKEEGELKEAYISFIFA